MLTIQPKISNYSAPKALNFKGTATFPDEDDYYKEKVDYFSKQAKEFNTLAEEESASTPFKKIMKGLGVVSTGILEGWAVMWGASKGAKFVKSGFMKAVDSNFAAKAKQILSPIKAGFSKSAEKIKEVGANAINALKEAKPLKYVAQKAKDFSQWVNSKSVGKVMGKAFNAIGKAIRTVVNFVKKPFVKVKEAYDANSAEQIYDKTSNVLAKTLGVGSGVTGAYVATTGKDKVEE